MKKNIILLLLIQTILLFSSSVEPIDSLSSIKYGIDVASAGRGNASTVGNATASAIYWNSSELCNINHNSVVLEYQKLSLDRSIAMLGYSQKLNEIGVGIEVFQARIGNIKEYSSSKKFISYFSASDIMLDIGAGYPLIKNQVFMGANIKYFRSSLLNNSGNGYGLNISGFYRVNPNIKLGLVFQDILSKISWNTDSNHSDNIPLSLRLGAKYSLFKYNMYGNVDIEYISQLDKYKYHIGIEYKLLNYFTLRAGLNNNNVAFGLSVEYSMINIDYAFAKDNFYNENNTHRIGIGYKFGFSSEKSMDEYYRELSLLKDQYYTKLEEYKQDKNKELRKELLSIKKQIKEIQKIIE